MRNPMLELARAEGHQPRHKLLSAPSSQFKPKGNSKLRAELFISKWMGGPFTTADIRALAEAPEQTGRDSARRTASYLVINGLARAIGKHSSGNTTLYELTGVSS